MHSNNIGNLAWPQTFYQLSNVTDIKAKDYLMGLCAFEKPVQDRMLKYVYQRKV